MEESEELWRRCSETVPETDRGTKDPIRIFVTRLEPADREHAPREIGILAYRRFPERARPRCRTFSEAVEERLRVETSGPRLAIEL